MIGRVNGESLDKSVQVSTSIIKTKIPSFLSVFSSFVFNVKYLKLLL